MLSKSTIFKISMCCVLLLSWFFNVSTSFADGRQISILGSSKVAVLEQDNNRGYIKLKVTDDKITKFQMSELMLVNDCSYYFGYVEWKRPGQTSNEFEINMPKNGTYAFYIFSNGKMVAYLRFKATGFSQDAIDKYGANGVTDLWGPGAEYFGLGNTPKKNPDDFRDFDGQANGMCINERIKDKPDGSGDVEEPPKKPEEPKKQNDGMKELMDKLNEIGGKIDRVGDKIPPPPDWDKVADTFANKISPRLTEDIKNMLGEAPDPPSPPPQIQGTDNKGLDKYEPDFKENKELKDAGFTADDIKNGAPPIKENKDEYGGFDIKDPLGSVPDLPKDLPKPGETEKSEWGKNKPKEPEQDKIPPPKDSKVDTGGLPKPKAPDINKNPKPNSGEDGGFPKPNTGGGGPPKPNDSGGSLPKPSGGGNPPNPHDDPSRSFGNYKRHPDAADGSG